MIRGVCDTVSKSSHIMRIFYPIFAVVLILALFLSGCGGSRGFKRGVKAYAAKSDRRADRIISHYVGDPVFGPGAELILLDMQMRKAKTLPELAVANKAYTELTAVYDTMSKSQAKILRKHKVGRGKLRGKHASVQRKAIRLAARNETVPMLDSVNKAIGNWLPPVREQWKTTRKNVVEKHLNTHDYDIATSILNHHLDVVEPQYARRIWTMRDSIWRYFKAKYPLCEIDKFRRDHSWHNMSQDCWHNEAKAVFCSGSLEKALQFQEDQPYSAYDFEILLYTLELAENENVYQLNESMRERFRALRKYVNLLLITNRCRPSATEDIYEDLLEILPLFAPRLGAYHLLMDATAFLFHTNQDSNAVLLLQKMKPLFPDTSVCFIADYDFQVNKLPRIDSCLACLNGAVKPLNYKPFNAINTAKFMEYGAVSYDEGHEMYFARRYGKGKVQVMCTTKAADGWSVPVEENTLSYNQIAIPMSITADGLQMLLKVDKYLFVSQRPNEDSPWNSPIRLPLKIKRLKRAVFSPDGTALLIEATMGKTTMNSKAESDLFYSVLDDKGAFSKPRSIGYPVNTGNKEGNPFLCSDGKTLYFSSERDQDGYGDMDIFVTRRKGQAWDDWTVPVNLGCQVNTSDNDYCYTWIPENGQSAFYTFVNPCSKDLNIYTSDIPQAVRPFPLRHLRGQLVNTKGKPIGRGFMELNINDGQEMVRVPISTKGKYHYVIPENTFKIKMYPEVSGYLATRDTVYAAADIAYGTSRRDTFKLLTTLEVKKYLELKYASFNAGSDQFNDPRVYREMELICRYATRMRAKILVIGHTDAPNSEALSLLRAEAVKQQFITRCGIAGARISVSGAGNTVPKCTTGSPDAARCNNRIEIKFDIPVNTPPIPDIVAPKPEVKYDTSKPVVSDEEEEDEVVVLENGEVIQTLKKPKTWIGRVWRKITGKDRRAEKKIAQKRKEQGDNEEGGDF